MKPLHPRYEGLTRVSLERLRELVPIVTRCNHALGFNSYESAPLWLVMNEFLRSTGAEYGFGHLLCDPQEKFLALAWDSDCWEPDEDGEWYDYATIWPLTESYEALMLALMRSGTRLAPITDIPKNVALALNLESTVPRWQWVYDAREFLYPTAGLVALQDPDNKDLSLPMRKRRAACKKFSDASKYTVTDIELVDDNQLLELTNSWLLRKEKSKDEVQTSDEYAILASKAGRAFMREFGIKSRGLALTTASERCLGFTYATEVSDSVWTMVARIHERGGNGVPPYVGEFLWREEARHWLDHETEADGGGSEGEDNEAYVGLTAQKYITLRAVAGAITEQGALVLTTKQARSFSESADNRDNQDKGIAQLFRKGH